MTATEPIAAVCAVPVVTPTAAIAGFEDDQFDAAVTIVCEPSLYDAVAANWALVPAAALAVAGATATD